MKYLNKFFENKSRQTKILDQNEVHDYLLSGDEVLIALAHKRIKKIIPASYRWDVSDDGLVNIYSKKGPLHDNTFSLKYDDLVDDKLPLKFGKCYGDFDCNELNLKTLVGSPYYVSGKFDCSHNQLTNLKNSPRFVGTKFECINNNLTTLIGGPEEVGEQYICSINKLVNLKGVAQSTLILHANDNKLTSLKGCPDKIEGLVFYNNKVTSLEGCPETMLFLDCSKNPIKSLKGAPKICTHFIFDYRKCVPKALQPVVSEYMDLIQYFGLSLEESYEYIQEQITSWASILSEKNKSILKKMELFLSSHEEFGIWNKTVEVNVNNVALFSKWLKD